jgi:hypothetical protein
VRLIALALWLLMVAFALPAEARRQREYPYAFDQVWNAALRLVRVDLRCAVTDRDPEGGYVLFEYESQGKRHPGSVELVRPTSGPGNTVVVVQVKGMPSYVEQMVLDRLDKKLLSEFGPPAKAPKPPPPAPPKPPEDAGEPPAEPNGS